MSEDPLTDKLRKEIQPEIDPMRAEHERNMRLIAQLREPPVGVRRLVVAGAFIVATVLGGIVATVLLR